MGKKSIGVRPYPHACVTKFGYFGRFKLRQIPLYGLTPCSADARLILLEINAFHAVHRQGQGVWAFPGLCREL